MELPAVSDHPGVQVNAGTTFQLQKPSGLAHLLYKLKLKESVFILICIKSMIANLSATIKHYFVLSLPYI